MGFYYFSGKSLSMKSITCMLLFVLATFATAAQDVFSNKTNATLKKVIEDYPNHFNNIKGDRISGRAEETDFKSKVEVPGAINCVVVESGSRKDAYSWKCELFASSDFEQAKSRFSELYKEIHNTIIKIEGERPFILNGKYELPDIDRKTTSVPFQLLPSTANMRQLKVELLLEHTADWKITLCVFDRDGQNDMASDQ